jgi:nucleoside-diphosphate-sugar epimerase
MLTGGTGFTGGHTAAALIAEGHEPHLLVRDHEKLERLCQLHGIDPGMVSFTVGDVRDERSVRAALADCQACIHAAAVIPRRAETMKVNSINDAGARTVLDSAVTSGCDPVIHISSLGLIVPSPGQFTSVDDPIREGGAPYLSSKAEADLHARALQGNGSPAVIVYPGGVAGPKDVGVNAIESLMARTRQASVNIRPPAGGILLVDVRDLALALTRLLDPGRGPRRYLAGGTFLAWDEFATHLDQATGLNRPLVDVTEQDMTTRFDPETARYLMELKPSDDGPIQRDTAVTWRPIADTLADLMAWIATRPT